MVAGGGVFTVIELDVAAVRLPDVKVSVCAPEPVIVNVLKVAMPVAFVVTVFVPPNVPEPLATATVTDTPDWLMLLLLASCRRTAAVNVAALFTDAGGCVDIASFVAVAGAVTVMALEFGDTTELEVNASVNDPEPVIERFVNVATPLALVVAVAVPPSVPEPVEIAAVTVAPLIALPDTSVTFAAGCGESATAEFAVAPGCVVIAT